jgi:hypothetical protein
MQPHERPGEVVQRVSSVHEHVSCRLELALGHVSERGKRLGDVSLEEAQVMILAGWFSWRGERKRTRPSLSQTA